MGYNTAQFFQAIFNADELTCFSMTAKATFLSKVSDWSERQDPFFSVNPLHTSRADANVTAFRTFLIECDKLPKHEQLEYIKGLGMPWTTCVDSGGKSVHFTICLDRDLPNEAAYRKLAARIHRVVDKADHTTKNPSRFSRVGGAIRDNGKEQKILGIRGRVSIEVLENWLSQFPDVKQEAEPMAAVGKGEGQLSAQTLNFIFHKQAPDGRNRALFMAACEFYRAGYTVQRAEGFLRQAFDFEGKDADFTEQEFMSTLYSAYRRAEQDAE